MVIDFHTHVFPEKIAKSTIEALAKNSTSIPYTDGTVQGLIDAMERADADISIALPVLTKPTQFESVAKFVISVNQSFENKTGRKIISFAGMHPACEDIDGKMQYLQSQGIKGVKIHPDYQQTYIDDDGYYEILRCAKKYDLIVVTHSGVDDGYSQYPVRCTPERVLKLIKEVDHGKFVLGHYGAHRLWEQTLEMLAGENVYFDTAYTFNDISEELFKKILFKHGTDKVLFATDCPWRDIKDDLSILRSYKLDKDVEDKILYKNALNLLKIKE